MTYNTLIESFLKRLFKIKKMYSRYYNDLLLKQKMETWKYTESLKLSNQTENSAKVK